MIKAIIFDLDGTLVDSLESISSSMNYLLKKHGFPIHTNEKYKMFVGDGIEELVYRALPETVRESEKLSDYIEEYRNNYGKMWRKSLKPYLGIDTMLKKLSKTEVKLFILSNKTDYFTKLQVNEIFREINFLEISGAREGVAKKPDPVLALKMVANYKIRPEDTIFTGDSPVDIITALRGHMKPVGVSWGFRSIVELRKAGAENILEKPDDIFMLL